MTSSLVHHLCTPSNSTLELRDQLYTNNININMDSSSSSSSSTSASPSSLTNPATTQAMAMAGSCTVPPQDMAEPAPYTTLPSMDHLHSSILQQLPVSDTSSSSFFNWSNSIPAVSHHLGFHDLAQVQAQAAAAAAMHRQMQGSYNNSVYCSSGYGELHPTVDHHHDHPSNSLYGSKPNLFRSVSLPARAALASAKTALVHNMQSANNYNLNQNHNLNQIPNHVISHSNSRNGNGNANGNDNSNTNANMLYRAESCSISGPTANLCSADQSLDNTAEVKPKGMASEDQERAIIKEETEQQVGAGSSSGSGKAAGMQQTGVNTASMGSQALKAATTTTTNTTRKRPRAADGSSCPSAQQQLKAAHLDTPPDVVHVRARRGQATDSHSLAERVRREKISQRMKVLQEIVPGCHKVLGKAMMLDEIINYVKSLQKQVEFLSMKLAAANQASMEPMVITKDLSFYNEVIQNASNFPLHGDASCINFVGEMSSTCQQIRTEGVMPSLIQ